MHPLDAVSSLQSCQPPPILAQQSSQPPRQRIHSLTIPTMVSPLQRSASSLDPANDGVKGNSDKGIGVSMSGITTCDSSPKRRTLLSPYSADEKNQYSKALFTPPLFPYTKEITAGSSPQSVVSLTTSLIDSTLPIPSVPISTTASSVFTAGGTDFNAAAAVAVPKKSGLERHHSESAVVRRSIFDRYWNHPKSPTGTTDYEDSSSFEYPMSSSYDSLRRKSKTRRNLLRSSSLPVSESHGTRSMNGKQCDPSLNNGRRLQLRHLSIDETNDNNASSSTLEPNEPLPCLQDMNPLVLQRLYSDHTVGKRIPSVRYRHYFYPSPTSVNQSSAKAMAAHVGTGGGAYPLAAAKPVLRRICRYSRNDNSMTARLNPSTPLTPSVIEHPSTLAFNSSAATTTMTENSLLRGAVSPSASLVSPTFMRKWNVKPSDPCLSLSSEESSSSSQSTLGDEDVCAQDEGRCRSKSWELPVKLPSKRKVNFDPRISVTEFHEDHGGRSWFSDADLDRFRMEAVRVVQQFMMKHPELIHLFNTPTRNPVTGKIRNKAFFSMLALLTDEPQLYQQQQRICQSRIEVVNASDCEDNDDSDLQRTNEMNEKRRSQHQADKTIRHILVVDPNMIILDLFRRSLTTIFPKARITTCQSGEEALELFNKSTGCGCCQEDDNSSFDLIIAEERLNKPLANSGTPLLSTHRKSVSPLVPSTSCENLREASSLSNVRTVSPQGSSHEPLTTDKLSRYVRHDSLMNLFSPKQKHVTKLGRDPSYSVCERGISGSQLLRMIASETGTSFGDSCSPASAKGNEAMDTIKIDECERSQGRPTNIDTHPECTIPLLIGVSTQSVREGDRFMQDGADLVWGKPPPSMNESLRDDLVSRLIRKRKEYVYSSCT